MMMKRIIILALILSGIGAFAQAPPKPYGPLPTKAQLNWQETEMYCLIHFGPDTYTDKEWGYGDEDPQIVNPTKFNAMQIVGAAKAGGFKGIIVVAKHHDGFCLWPTKTTEHNISHSPYKNGKGDIVKEYREACDKLGMKMGVYCSPWDRNSALYGNPEYVTQVYREQLKELYSNYGPLFIIWHDGANGGDGYYGGAKETRTIDRSTYYGWDTTWAIARKLQPGAVIFGDVGPDVRWVGHESGEAGDPCWETYTPHAPDAGKIPANGYVKSDEGIQGQRDGKYWIPAECDVPLRPGWFYHQQQDTHLKSVDTLLSIYYKSVGRGAGLDLGLSPDRDGLLNENDVDTLKKFGQIIANTFAINLAKGATLKASNVRGGNKVKYGPQNLLDNDRYTYWATDNNIKTPQLVIDLHRPKTFNVIRLRENIKLGQRIEGIAIDQWRDGQWREIATATSIGGNRLIKLNSYVTAQKLRLRITQSPVCIALSDFGLYSENLMESLIKGLEGKVSSVNAAQTLYDTTAKPQLISHQFAFTEGASTDKKGNVFFTDQPNNKIWEYDVNGKLSLFLDSAGRSNGMYFDHKGNLVTCADEHDQVWAISPKGKIKVLLTDYKGHLMNGPNDIWIDSKGGIYMTDPYYQRDYWARNQSDLDGEKVYYLPKNSKQPIIVDADLKKPNGIVGTPDGKYLYVSDIGAGKTYKYTINANGTLSNRQLIINQGSDGMTLDARGDIYLTGKGVTIYNPVGIKIGHIAINEPWTGNLCFGGRDKDVLFITASTAIYTLKMNVKGVE